MLNFILNGIFWTLALYGFFEIIKNIVEIFTCTKLKTNGIYVIIATKNQEDKIEGFLRSFLFKFIYGREDMIKNIILADLDSKDETMKILKNVDKDYDCVKAVRWKDCRDILDNIDIN